MYQVWSFFTKRRNFSYLVLVALTVAGLSSLLLIQKESNPEVTVPIGTVTTVLPGASASDVETLITNELEDSLIGSLDEVEQVTSASRNGLSSITVEFDSGADIDAAIQDLKDAVDRAKVDLPEEAEEPQVQQIDFSQDPVITFAVSGELPPAAFTELAKQLQDDIENINGVSNVIVGGFRERETQVVVDAEALRRYALPLTDVTNAIARSNATLPVGSIEFDGVSYNVQYEADIPEPAAVRDIPITTRGGQPVYVRDVALVSDGLGETVTLSRVSIDGAPSKPALSFNVQKQTGADVTAITNAVNDRLDALQQPGELLADMDVVIIFDTGELLLEDLLTLSQSGAMAVLLVMGVLLLTIGWRESLVAGLSIPLSFMIAFIGLELSGNTLNFVSLFALILSVGILVDSAIVITEGIHSNMRLLWERRKENNAVAEESRELERQVEHDKQEAALKAIRDYHTPVTAGTMTTVAVFVPLFFISGIVGEFIESIPFTVISVLFASLVVALGFVPLMASIILKRRTTSRLEELQEEYTIRVLGWYKARLQLILGHFSRENLFIATIIALFFATPVLPTRGLFAALIFATAVGTVLNILLARNIRWLIFIPATLLTIAVSGSLVYFFPPFLTTPVEFFPGGNEDYLLVEIELPEGTVLEKSELEARKIEEILYEQPDIASYVMTVGASSAFTGTGGSQNSKFANAFLNLKEGRTFTSGELAEVLIERFSTIDTADVRVTELANGPPVGTPVVIKFRGDDMEAIEQLAVEAGRILREIDGTNAVTTSTRNDNTEFVITIDKAEAAAVGLDPSLIALTLRTTIEGSDATTINTATEDIDVVVKLALNDEYLDPHSTNEVTPDTLRSIELQTPAGTIFLGSLVDVVPAKGSATIRHEDGERIATAESQLTEDGNVAAINAEFQRRAQTELDIPDGIEMIVGGENEETQQSFAEMGLSIIAGLILMYAIIVLMFNSFRHSLYVLAPAFFSFIGIALGLTISANALSFPSLMGLIALIGIVVNNSIILINVMNGLRYEHPDWSSTQIALEGAAARLRPILLTTLTTVIGIFPLLFASSLWAPLALAIIFGLSFSVLITLVLIPVIYARNPGKLE